MRGLNKTQRVVIALVTAWLVGTAVASAAVIQAFRIDEASPPNAELERWAIEMLKGAATSPAPGQYTAAAPIQVSAWKAGKRIATHLGDVDLVASIDGARDRFRDIEADAFAVTVPVGQGPLVRGVPYLEALNLVPLREGLVATLDGATAVLTPSELIANRDYETGIYIHWIPDLNLGVKMDALVARLAGKLGTDPDTLSKLGTIRRMRAHTVAEAAYPGDDTVTEASLRAAADEGARFLLRHQKSNGMYTYLYDGHTARGMPGHYNIPRHAGTTYFLGQVAHMSELPEAREGALRALKWIRTRRIRRCGARDRWCVGEGRRIEIGSSALTVLAAVEVLEGGPDEIAQQMVEGITAFLRAQQRDDGEMMHEYDLAKRRPIDVQHMYYSGEAAFALLNAYRVLKDPANLEAARKLMAHLTGAGWNFFGSRYYYGEEHWTCIAVGAARGLIDLPEGLDFCERWAEFSDWMQYDDEQTPWQSEGGYGVGPFFLPRLAPVGSRTEAFVSVYQLAKMKGAPTERLRRLIEHGLGQLLRWRFAPGPTHLLADPAGAFGGVPATPGDLAVRNDFVQHAGSAWIRWAEILREEQSGSGAAQPTADPD